MLPRPYLSSKELCNVSTILEKQTFPLTIIIAKRRVDDLYKRQRENHSFFCVVDPI